MRFHLDGYQLSHLLYLFILLLLAFLLLISGVFLLSQAVRTSPSRTWARNVNALIIGASYILVLIASMLLCVKRRLSVRRSLAHIPRGRIAIGKADMPRAVHLFVEEELLRACAIAQAARPKVESRDGWGAPGSKYEGVRFRTALWDEVPKVDDAARAVIPSIPPLSPHADISQHFRHLAPLIGNDADGRDPLRTFTDAVERSKKEDVELTQREFEDAMESSRVVQETLTAYQGVLRNVTAAMTYDVAF